MARCPTLNSSPFDAIKPNEKILNVVADRAGNYWFRLLSNLGVPKSTIDSFKSDNATVRDACFVGLVFWLTGGVKDSEEPVLFITLFKALRESMMTDCVSVLEKKLEKKHSDEDLSTQTKQIAEVLEDIGLMKAQHSKMTKQLDLTDKSLKKVQKEHDQRPSKMAEVLEEMRLMKEQQSKYTEQLDLAFKFLNMLLKEHDQRPPKDTSGRPVMVPPVWLDQSESSPPYPTAHSLPPIEQLNIAPLFSPRVQLQNPPNLVKACKQIEVGPPAVFKLVPKHWKENEKHKIASCIVGEDTSYMIRSLHKVIMVVGVTGSGKSTIINALANYMLGVTFSDPHRYQLITQADEGGRSQAFSQTSWVNAYTFPTQPGSRIPYTLTIVDTPGYGSTEGVDRDINITKQIKFFLESKEIGVDQINAIALVVKANEVRVTKVQKYVFKSILALFAKNTAPGMMVVATHADGKAIKPKRALKDASVPVQDELTFAVDNSALYAPNVTGVKPDDDFVLHNKITWNRNDKVFRTMYDAVGQMPSISLWQTKENLKERDTLRLILESIGPQIQEVIDNARSSVKLSDVIKCTLTEIRKAQLCIKRIQKISLNPNPTVFTEEFIVELIFREKNEMEEGWEERITSMNQLERFAKVTKAIEEKDHAALLKELHMNP